jgi:hypothetical protein
MIDDERILRCVGQSIEEQGIHHLTVAKVFTYL